jgi:hypothetical protein
MSARANCKLSGRWRIVGADIWDHDYLDLCGPATITITDHGRGVTPLWWTGWDLGGLA